MNQVKTLPKRSEIPPADRWRLEDIFPDDKAWEEAFARAKTMIPQVVAYRGTLGHSPKQLLGCLKTRDALGELFERVYVYARMRRDEDNANPFYQSLHDRAEGLGVEIGAALAYIVPEILALPPETIAAYLKEEPGLTLYRHHLEEILRRRPHTLSAAEEELLARTGEILQAPENIFTMLDTADLKFPTIRDEEGRPVELTKGRYITFLESPVRRVRQEAFQTLYATYGQRRHTLAATLAASVKVNVFVARVRRHPSALAAALFEDNIPPVVYDNLIATVREGLPLLHRYLALKKELMGLDELHLYDVYAPPVPDPGVRFSLEEAKEIVTRSLAPLGPEYLEVLRAGFADRWIDPFENEGKTGGAYSWGPYGVHPYVLLNYQGRLKDLFTLAHEMGHAMHSYYSYRNQPFVYAHYSIFVAEVASILNETFLFNHLLSTNSERAMRLHLLHHYLEEFRATVFRQTMFAEFEKEIHARVEAGEALTAQELCRIYLGLNRDYFGPGVAIDPEIELEWARIPHFYNAFYVYKYATGFAAATALADRILHEGEPALRRYLEFLKSGAADYPNELLKRAGVDLTSPEPIVRALKVFAANLDRLVEEVAGGKSKDK
ncbi:MAG: oligoendopeptidase F [Firmicutes bacterium]|nr:oligoendopeptidase F [Bacillota bacterium]